MQSNKRKNRTGFFTVVDWFVNYRLEFIAILTLIFLFFLRYYDLLFGSQILSAFRDNTYIFGPEFSYISHLFRSGEYPYWIQGMLGGVQFYDNAQFSMDYPFYFFRFLDYGIGVTTLRMITLVSLLHVLILTVNTYVALRVLSVTQMGSVIGAGIHMSCLNTSLYAKWIVIIAAYSWFPLFIAGLYLLISSPKSWKGVILTTVSICGFMANPAQPIIHALIFGLGFLGVGVITTDHRAQFIKMALISGTLGFLLSSSTLISVLKGMKDMIRWVGHGKSVVGHQRLPLEVYSEDLNFSDLISVVVDPLQASGVGSPFIGPLALLLSVIGFLAIKSTRDRQKRYFLVTLLCLAIYAFLSAMGDTSGFVYLNYLVPLLNKIREPVRHLFFFSLAISIFSGLGFDILRELTKSRRSTYFLSVTLAVIVISILINYQELITRYNMLLTLLMTLISLIWYRAKYSVPLSNFFVYAPVIFAFLLVIQFSTRGVLTDPARWEINMEANTNSMEVLSFLKGIDSSRYRVVYHDSSLGDGQWSMNGLYYGIRSFQSQHVPIPFNQFRDLYNRDQYHHYRAIWGAKFHVFRDSMSYPIHSDNTYNVADLQIVEDGSAYEHGYLATRIVPCGDMALEQFLGKLSAEIEPGVAYIDTGSISQNDIIKRAKQSDTLIQVAAGHNEFLYYVNTPEQRLFVLNEYFSSNWHFKVNGEKLPAVPVNFNQIGCVLPEGSYTLEVYYSPRAFVFFWWVSRITLIIVAISLLLEVIRRYQWASWKL